ncbi:hypothetical protein K493DRAFT_387161 [Basidiobolus meristosporus CBS 931.73]|uniref:Uncharacterized protein n=1 Tax=Basidiobolus meristosporus CBS 931.73 TaxID=1314790 RepID=A0A1Y1YVS0_9FUNG|nr:hypothetical protein K493DRAFT_387161 [Basidiobolus meristosporus CBS 931.73]|eukprot:ORY02148.1 hypothetical protein K493DRAFT_387161 [Basidiobolus meristosporus CBS 931.73]
MKYISFLLVLSALQLVKANSYGGGGNDRGVTSGSWEDSFGDYQEDEIVKKCVAPSRQAPFNNKAVSLNVKTDPASFDSNPHGGRGQGIVAQSMLKAGLTPGKTLHVNGFQYRIANWGKGRYDNWIEKGQQVKVTTVPAANRLGFLLASDMGSFKGIYEIVYTDCSKTVVTVGASDWKWKIELAHGNTVAQRGLVATYDRREVRLYSAEVNIDQGKEIAYIKFPTKVSPIHAYMKGYSGHIHVFSVATKKVGY